MLLRVLRAVIFDLDGVLADSEPWWNQIDAKLLAEYGADYRGEHHQQVLGVSYRIAVEFYKKAFNLTASTEQMMKRRGEIATKFFAEKIGLFPGTRRVLEELREMPAVVERLGQTPGVSPKRLRLAVGTSSVSASARPFLNRHQLTEFFDVIVTGEEVDHGKPAPDIYLRAAEKLAVPVGECLVVEDALSGVAAAKSAGMPVAAIPDRRFVDPRAYEKEAEYVLSSLTELPALARKLVAGS
jgi:beta-phosphoglucomutase-like phosphatase (HAD superfamily)